MTEQGIGHSHRFPRGILALIIICVLGLSASIILSAVRTTAVDERLAALEEYVEGRGAYRDRESERLEALINRVVCDILGEFPDGDPRADRLRARYDCEVA